MSNPYEYTLKDAALDRLRRDIHRNIELDKKRAEEHANVVSLNQHRRRKSDQR